MIGKKVKPSEQKKSNMAILRLQKDYKEFAQRKMKYTSLQFPNPNSIQHVIVTIELDLSQEDQFDSKSPYNGTRTKFQMVFPDTYPIDPPKLKCLTRIYHPNISYNGSVCLPLVRQDWSPIVSFEMIVYGLIFILMHPNGDDALEPQIGDQMSKDIKIFEKIVEHTKVGRVFQQKQYDNIQIKQKGSETANKKTKN